MAAEQPLGLPSAIVLAAGRASRFGSDKLLHPLFLAGKTQPLILHSLAPWFAVFKHITVVVRSDSVMLPMILSSYANNLHKDLDLVISPHAELGLGYSLKAGVLARPNLSGWVIGLADMPLIPPQVIEEIIFEMRQGASIAAPYFKGKRGHPVGFSNRYEKALTTPQGDIGAQHLLKQEQHQIQQISAQHDGILKDIDLISDVLEIEGSVLT